MAKQGKKSEQDKAKKKSRVVAPGTYCKKVAMDKRLFHPASYRWKQSGKAWLMVGCPRTAWVEATRRRPARCRVGMQLHYLMVPKHRSKKCGKGLRRFVVG